MSDTHHCCVHSTKQDLKAERRYMRAGLSAPRSHSTKRDPEGKDKVPEGKDAMKEQPMESI